ncbi:MAG: hypothetical protein ACP5IG_01460 [Candidatus Micrarchaeia archaeon]
MKGLETAVASSTLSLFASLFLRASAVAVTAPLLSATIAVMFPFLACFNFSKKSLRSSARLGIFL